MSYCGKCHAPLPQTGRYTTFDMYVKPRVTLVLCWNCYSKIQDIRAKRIARELIESNYLVYHRCRARKLGLVADLTLAQWNETKEHFHYTCAYCQSAGIYCLEHFIPLELGGGTTKWNCVPSCIKCNRKKNGLHPALVKCIPEQDIERVRGYLMNFL